MFGFLDALDLSAVPLYGDERSITSSASNFGTSKMFAICAEQKPNAKSKTDKKKFGSERVEFLF